MQCVWSALPGMHGTQALDKMACLKPHPSPIPDHNLARKNHHHQLQQQQQFKRKRTDSNDTVPPKRQKPVDAISQATVKFHQAQLKFTTTPTMSKATVAPSTIHMSQAAAEPTKDDATPQQQPVPAVTPSPAPVTETTMSQENSSANRTRAHDRIEANLNLQILLKHDELRLIEQELGKCQIALEQLRRCKVIPFPGQPGSQATADDITSGTGSALRPPAGLSLPPYPAPYGVTDGPYSRHYAQWLIPDPSFDPSLPRAPRISTGGLGLQGRSMRGSYDMTNSAATPRSGRASLSSQHSTLPGNFSVPRDRHAPLTVPRPSDGQLVKIVCKVCGKKDSANVQGFTNHCRIAHGINYASHSEAIIDCGQPVSSDEVPAYVAPCQTPVEPKPVSAISSAPQSTGKPLVHPLITASVEAKNSNQSIFGNAAPPTVRSKSTDQTPNLSGTTSEAEFVPSTDSPHLSALLKKRGFNGDLKSLITTSKQKIDLSQVSPLVSDEDDDSQPTNPQNSAASTPQRIAVKPKNRRPNIPMSGVRVPGRSQGGPSKLQINTTAAAAASGEPHTANSSHSSTATTPSISVQHRAMVPDSFSSNTSTFSSVTSCDSSVDGRRTAPNSTTSSMASPMEIDQPELLDASEDSSEVLGSANLSPNTIDTNPGLVTDNEDDIDYVDSEHDEEHDSVGMTIDRDRHIDVGVTVREEGDHHTEEMMQQLEHASDDKSKDPPSLRNGVVERGSSVVSGGTSTPRKRGRPRKNP